MASTQGTFNLTRVKEIFGRALEFDADGRDEFIRAECGGDERLLSEVRRLLRAHDSATGFLDQPTMSAGAADIADRATPAQIGPYRIVKRLGEGGFGAVHLAEQETPVRRQVALKVLRLGLDSRQMLARFEVERQALALMSHPNIAHIYDAGTTDDRRPYFVMELVDGVPITAFAAQRNLTVVDRLRLFADVCRAVGHAHQKGVIHRDLKPTNVLVVEDGGRAVAKVIDFGVAKALHRAGLSEGAQITEDRQLIGTPEYMSPEQSSTAGADIDTRSDIYSLGVLLYELLTGVTPFDPAVLRSKSLSEMQRIITQDDPPRPSTRVLQRTTGGTGRLPAGRVLAWQLRGELDWIVMKCLEKDRARRYESAAALVADIENYLAGRPVLAGPPTRMYRVGKFVRRHRLSVGGAAVVLVTIIGALVASLMSLRQARIERDRAVTARAAEEAARTLAEEHVQFVQEMFASIRPEHARGREVTVREVLDIAAARADGSFREEPAAEVAIRGTFGVAYAGIGLLDRAREQYERAIQRLTDAGRAGAPEMIDLKTHLGELEAEAGRFQASETLLRDAYEASRARFGMENKRTLLAAEKLASLLNRTSALSEAERIRTEIDPLIDRVFGPASQATLAFRANFALLRHAQGRFEEAERMYRQALDAAERNLGPNHPDTIGVKYSLATLLRDQGKFADSLRLFEEALKYARTVFGPDHPNTLGVAHQVALMLSSAGRSGEAESLLLDTIERCRRVLGEDHPTTLFSRHDLVQIRMLSRRNTENVEQEMLDLTARISRALGADHRDTLMFQADLARILSGRGDYAGAQHIYAEIFPRLRQTLGQDHPYTLSVEVRLAQMMGRQGNWADAEPLLARAYQVNKREGMAARDWSSPAAYGLCLEQLGKYSAALPVLHEAEAAMKAYRKLDRAQMRSTATSLAVCYERLGQPDRAAEYRALAEQMAAALSASTQPARQ